MLRSIDSIELHLVDRFHIIILARYIRSIEQMVMVVHPQIRRIGWERHSSKGGSGVLRSILPNQHLLVHR